MRAPRTSVIDSAVELHYNRPSVDHVDELGECFLTVCGHCGGCTESE